MNRLFELQNKLAEQNKLVRDLEAQVARSVGDENRGLTRKRERAASAAQAIQHDLDAMLNRVAYLQQAERRAQENLDVITRHITATRLTDLANAESLDKSRDSAKREIDRLRLQIARLGAPDSQVQPPS
jgi:hypothetical protein